MQIIEPTKNEVFDELISQGCRWLGRQGCECFSGIKSQGCYDHAKESLTRTVYTPEEIEAQKERRRNDPYAPEKLISAWLNEMNSGMFDNKEAVSEEAENE